MYPVKYKGLSCFAMTCMSSGVKAMQGIYWGVEAIFFNFLLRLS